MRIFASFSGLELEGPVGVRPVVHGGKVRHCVRVLALPVTVEHTVQVTLAHLVSKINYCLKRTVAEDLKFNRILELLSPNNLWRCVGIVKQSMGTRNRVGIGLS